MISRVALMGVEVDCTSYEKATAEINNWAEKGESRYVCAANVHMVMEALDSARYREVVNSADLVTPDGMPLVWMLRWMGASKQQRVYGPTLMLWVAEAAAKRIPVGFYGSTPEVLQRLNNALARRFDGLKVAYRFSPPFRPLAAAEDNQIVDAINQSGTRILFVGLGCPKQEEWMAEHRDRIRAVMLGVGAAFDFHAGTIRQAPAWVQDMGLEWLFRLTMEPRRLWRRYLKHNPRFACQALLQLSGLRRSWPERGVINGENKEGTRWVRYVRGSRPSAGVKVNTINRREG